MTCERILDGLVQQFENCAGGESPWCMGRDRVIENQCIGRSRRADFLALYPFREHPEKIEALTRTRVYNPGDDEYFFIWISPRLKWLGAIDSPGFAGAFRNAAG